MDGGVSLINVNKFDDGWWNIDPTTGQKTTPISWNTAKYGDPVSTSTPNVYFLPYKAESSAPAAPTTVPNLGGGWQPFKRYR